MQPRPQRFVPRATLILGGGILLFFLSSMTYALVPVMLGPIPENAADSYVEERVKARLAGKIPWFLGTSMIVAGAIGARLSRPK